jgi:hypothetical protein
MIHHDDLQPTNSDLPFGFDKDGILFATAIFQFSTYIIALYVCLYAYISVIICTYVYTSVHLHTYMYMYFGDIAFIPLDHTPG